MNKEVKAVVLGLVVVVLFAIGLAVWRGPARDFHRIKGFRVEVKTRDGDETRKLSIPVPVSLIAQLARLANIDDALDGEIRAHWDDAEITPRQILDAADASTNEKPGVLKHEDHIVEVRAAGEAILIDVRDDFGEKVHIQLPRYLVEVFADDQPLTARELLRRLDELNPGDIVTIRDRDDEITIKAEPRKGVQVSWKP
jgi:hypothetical protein